MSKIVVQMNTVYSWLSSKPASERERTHHQIMMTFTEVRFHTPGI